MKKTSRQLVEEAEALIETLPVEQAITLLGSEGVQFVDLRERGELRRDGEIPGAVHAPRGMLEFWADPESPYYKPELSEDRKLVLFCAAGWRSALATRTLQEMGRENVCHIGGGFGAWTRAGGPVKGGSDEKDVSDKH